MKIGEGMESIAAREIASQFTPTERVKDDFGSLFEKTVGEVNEMLQSADRQANQLATGKAENLHESMIAFEKAETALKLLVQVRNKAIEAYNQIIQMQV